MCKCVLYYCHRVATQLQLNISYIIYEIMCKITVERSKPKMTVCRMRIACWIPKATNTYTFMLFNIHCFSAATMVCTNAPQCTVICALSVLFLYKTFQLLLIVFMYCRYTILLPQQYTLQISILLPHAKGPREEGRSHRKTSQWYRSMLQHKTSLRRDSNSRPHSGHHPALWTPWSWWTHRHLASCHKKTKSRVIFVKFSAL
jgi:hypothetical protein